MSCIGYIGCRGTFLGWCSLGKLAKDGHFAGDKGAVDAGGATVLQVLTAVGVTRNNAAQLACAGCAEVEAQRMRVPAGLSDERRARIQATEGEVRAARQEFRRLLDEEIERLEPARAR